MIPLESFRVVAVVIGIILGHGFGRWLWVQRHVVPSPWIVIAILTGVGLITLRLAAAFDLGMFWEVGFFPLLVGWGAGFAVTPARLPLNSLWWQIWKQ